MSASWFGSTVLTINSGFDDASDDPAWWDVDGAVHTRAGRLTDPAPDPLWPRQMRAFGDGSVIVCGLDTLGTWENGTWTEIPFPTDLPNPLGEMHPWSCSDLVAASTREAWFVLSTGLLCRYDGVAMQCADVSDGIATRSVGQYMAMTPTAVFIANEATWEETHVFVVDRGALPESVREVAVTWGIPDSARAVPGADEIVIGFSDRGTVRSPSVFSIDGSERVIDIDFELKRDGVAASYLAVPMARGDTFVAINRVFTEVGSCVGPSDDPMCTTDLHWAEIVVERETAGRVSEVGHVGRSGPLDLWRALRVDGQLMMLTDDGWLRLP